MIQSTDDRRLMAWGFLAVGCTTQRFAFELQTHLEAVGLQVVADLGEGGRLAHAVDPHKDDRVRPPLRLGGHHLVKRELYVIVGGSVGRGWEFEGTNDLPPTRK